MFQITINEKGGPSRSENFDKNEIQIGRVQGNDIVLPKGNISKKHSKIVLKDGKFIIVDLKSTNGTYVNGKKITAPQVIKSTDKIYIGDFTLQISASNGAAASVERELDRPRPPEKEEGIDLFGGDSPEPSPRAASSGPGLIDENFDQEFGAPDAPPKPSRGGKRSLAPKAEDPAPLALELDASDGDALELDAGFDDPPPPALELADVPEPELEPEPEPEPRAPVLPIKPTKSPPARTGPSRVRPVPAGRGRPTKDEAENSPLEPETVEPIRLEATDPEKVRERLSQAEAAEELGHIPPISGADLQDVPSIPEAPEPDAAPVLARGAVAAVAGPVMDRADALRHLHVGVVEQLGLRGLELGRLSSQRARVIAAARAAAANLQASGQISAGEDVSALANDVAKLALDFDLILDLIQDETVVEIAITYDRQILADRDGRLEPIDRMISSEEQVADLIRRLGVLGGADPGSDSPLLDVRLRDGARVVGSLPPLAFRGPTLAYRKTTRDFFTLDKLLEYSTISEGMLAFVDYCLRFRKNILLAVGPGVSPTATLNALLAQMPADERLVTIENGVELHFGMPRNVTALEPSGGIGVPDLVQHAVVMEADRVVLGAIDGLSSARILGALGGPLSGSVASVSAASPKEAVDRIAKELVMFDGAELEDAQRLVAASFPVVLQESRFLDNSRRITSAGEVLFSPDTGLVVEEIFNFTPDGLDENAIVTGHFGTTGYTPRFIEELVDRGEAEVDMEIFKQ